MNPFYRPLTTRCFCLVFVCLLWSGVLVIRAIATPRYVVPPGTIETEKSALPYNTWTNAATNIQWAVDAAVDDETVHVTNGSYCITNQIAITNRIIVKSETGYTNTSVYADWPAYTTRCFYVVNTGTLDGFTVSNGHYHMSNDYDGGGGVHVATNGMIKNCYFINNVCSNAGSYSGGGGAFVGSNGVVVSNCTFIFNKSYKVAGSYGYSGYAGGVYVRYGNVFNSTIFSNSQLLGGGSGSQCGGGGIYGNSFIISNCVIANNYAYGGGGAGYLLAGGQIIDCIISNNNSVSAGGGFFSYSTIISSLIVDNYSSGAVGGIYVHPSYYGTVSNCVITGNRNTHATVPGGAFSMGSQYYSHQVSGCRISNNIAPGGGGIYVTNTGQVINSLICNNTNSSAAAAGGGILAGHSAVKLTLRYGIINCTIADNYSAGAGGGIATLGVSNYVANCVIANNRADISDPDIYNTADNSNSFWYSCATNVLFNPDQRNLTNGPAFVNAGAGNYRLGANSPCVNTGTNLSAAAANVGSKDLDGRARIRYGRVDMGAYERINEGTIYNVR